jgi:hypothetical protein
MSYSPYPSTLSEANLPYPTQVVLPASYRCSGGHITVAWLGAIMTLGYLLPWAIGASRNRPNCLAIAMINVFLGWTGLGWFAALVLACLPNPQPLVILQAAATPHVPLGSEHTVPLPFGPTGYGPGTRGSLSRRTT